MDFCAIISAPTAPDEAKCFQKLSSLCTQLRAIAVQTDMYRGGSVVLVKAAISDVFGV